MGPVATTTIYLYSQTVLITQSWLVVDMDTNQD